MMVETVRMKMTEIVRRMLLLLGMMVHTGMMMVLMRMKMVMVMAVSMLAGMIIP